MSYVKSRSWHSVLTVTRSGSLLTRCGRVVKGPDSETLPLAEKSCESCLRLEAHNRATP